MTGKVFTLKGRVRKVVPAIPFTKPDGSTGYTDQPAIAKSFNARFGHLAPKEPVVIPARETFEGAA